MELETVHFFLRAALSYLGAVGAYMGFTVLWKLYKEEDVAMVSFQLKPEDALEDFKIMILAEAFMILGFMFYVVGGATDSPLFLNIGRTYAVFLSLFFLDIFYRWWKRF